MLQVFAIAGGGALGALLRFWMSNGVYALLGRGFPYGTLAVNVLGSFVMGILFVLFVERLAVSPELRAGVLVGFLGAFTTFSTFAVETLNLVMDGAMTRALLNVVASVLVCVLAAFLGMFLGRQL